MNDSKSTVRLVSALLGAIGLFFLSSTGFGQNQPTDGLTGIDPTSYENDVERAAAVANQNTFDALHEECDPNNTIQDLPNPSAPGAGATAICTGDRDVFNVYLTVRELVHTANQLLNVDGGQRPQAASLNVDQTGLGTSLRWTAAE